MTAAEVKAVVLLHGLYQARADPFGDLVELERAIQDAGFMTRRFQWPAGRDNIWALHVLRDRNRSLADELAKALDDSLRTGFRGDAFGSAWALVGHSAGGLAIYRWLTGYSQQFYLDGGSPPALVVTIAAPYQCALDEIRLNGKPFEVHEPAVPPAAIVEAVPRKLLVCVAGKDDVLDPNDVILPPGVVGNAKVDQQLIDGSSHAEICRQDKTKRLVTESLITALKDD